MKKMILVMTLFVVPSILFSEKVQVPASSWTNKANTPFFVTSTAVDKSDYDGVRNATKNNVEAFLSENLYKYKTQKDGTEFIIDISKNKKDKTEITIYDASTAEGIVPATEDSKGKDTLKKFAEAMKSWDQNGAPYKVIFQDASLQALTFKDMQPIKGKITSDPNYGGQWQTAGDAVLLTYKGTVDTFVDSVVKAVDTLEPVSIEGRKITFKLTPPPPAPVKEEPKKEITKEPKKVVKKEEDKKVETAPVQPVKK